MGSLQAIEPKPGKVGIDGKWSATEGGRTIEAYSLDNPHATGYIIPYIPDAKFGFVTDIWSPVPNIPPANPDTISVAWTAPTATLASNSRLVALLPTNTPLNP
jgi:hypothetical protein